jgi:hypothetical protein
MRIFNLIIVWVLLQGTPFIRDIFNLPLHDSRFIVIDFILLTLGFSLFIYKRSVKYINYKIVKLKNFPQKEVFQPKLNLNNKFLNIFSIIFNKIYLTKFIIKNTLRLADSITFNRMILLWLIPAIFIYFASKINESSNLLFFKQYFLFYVLIQFIFWSIKHGGINALFNSILNGSIVFLVIQSLFFFLNIAYSGVYQDIIEKNSFPILMLLMSELSRVFGDKKFYKSFFFIGLISALIASTKIFFLLLSLLFFINKIKIIKANKKFSLALHFGVILFPIFFPYLINFITDIDINDIIELGDNRYFINNNIGSLISRVYSVEYMLEQENFWNIFGNNESSIADVNFWGYPVHNLYFSLAYAHGYLLLLVLFLYNISIYRFLANNIGLGLILGFLIIYLNDIPPMLSLLFIPYIIIKNRKII